MKTESRYIKKLISIFIPLKLRTGRIMKNYREPVSAANIILHCSEKSWPPMPGRYACLMKMKLCRAFALYGYQAIPQDTPDFIFIPIKKRC